MLTSLHLHLKSSEVCIKTRSPPASLPFQGQVTKHTTVKWPIETDESGAYNRELHDPREWSDTYSWSTEEGQAASKQAIVMIGEDQKNRRKRNRTFKEMLVDMQITE